MDLRGEFMFVFVVERFTITTIYYHYYICKKYPSFTFHTLSAVLPNVFIFI